MPMITRLYFHIKSWITIEDQGKIAIPPEAISGIFKWAKLRAFFFTSKRFTMLYIVIFVRQVTEAPGAKVVRVIPSPITTKLFSPPNWTSVHLAPVTSTAMWLWLWNKRYKNIKNPCWFFGVYLSDLVNGQYTSKPAANGVYICQT